MWFKVDDGFSHHPKVLAAGNAAIGLWVRAGSYSMQHLTEGFVPDAVVTSLGTKAQADLLVQAGLWERGPTGYIFHDWDMYQPSKEKVTQEREAAAERKRRSRDRRLRSVEGGAS